MSGLEGQVALVTGASRGIGAAIADRLAADGAFVYGTATSVQGAAAIDSRLGENGTGLVYDASAANAAEQVLERPGTDKRMPSILVNNAAVTRDTLLLRMKDADWDAVLETNLGAVFRLTRGCLRAMVRARYGRIVNLTSIVGVTGNPGQANYAASKAALLGFGKSLAREVAARGITVNAIAPGFIDTDMTRALNDEQRAQLLGQIPAGRLGAGSDVANAVAFLCANEASYITGHTLHVNGGMLME